MKCPCVREKFGGKWKPICTHIIDGVEDTHIRFTMHSRSILPNETNETIHKTRKSYKINEQKIPSLYIYIYIIQMKIKKTL